MDDMLELIITIAKFGLLFVALALVPLMILMERRGSAIIQDRVGPNRAALQIPGLPLLSKLPPWLRLFGFIHNFTDAVKLFFKEDMVPARAHRWFYILAPSLPVITAILTPALIPFFAPMHWIGGPEGGVSGQVIDSETGLLMLFAFASLSVYGVVLGGWASNSKFPLLGGLRASAVMISYEVAMGLAVLGLLLIVGSLSLTEVVEWQATHAWGIIVQPLGLLCFLPCVFAESGRNPFDVQEGESEIAGGFHIEYSSMKFAMFFMGEYAHLVVGSLLLTTLYFGGYHLPFLGTEVITGNSGTVLGVLLLAITAVVTGVWWLLGRHQAHYRQRGIANRVIELDVIRTVLLGLGGLLTAGGVLSLALVPNPGSEIPAWSALLTAGIQLGIVLLKTLCFCWLFIWVRWTLPRFRYDQIMTLGWKYLLNIALANLLLTAVAVLVIQEMTNG